MKPIYYVLDGKEVRTVKSPLEWGRWYAENDRHVAQTHVDHFFVSTVFLGLDHGWRDEVLLFETMVFDGDGETIDWGGLQCRRYATWAQAEAGHIEFVECLMQAKDSAEEAARLLLKAQQTRNDLNK